MSIGHVSTSVRRWTRAGRTPRTSTIETLGWHPMVRASIVIVNHNHQRFLVDAIESALDQTVACEVVVVDDHSTDGSVQSMSPYRDRIELVVMPKNVGQLEAFAAGVEHCRGDFVFPLDADDRAKPQRVERTLTAFDADPRVVQVSGMLDLIDDAGASLSIRSGRGRRLIPGVQPHPSSGDVLAPLLRFGHYEASITSGMAWRRTVLVDALESRPLDRRVPLDTYLAAVMPFLGQVAGIRTPVFDYRLHGNNAVGGQRSIEPLLDMRSARHQIIDEWAKRVGRSGGVDPQDDSRWVLDRFLAGHSIPRRSRLRAVIRTPLEQFYTRPGVVPAVNQFLERVVMASSRELGADVVSSGLVRSLANRSSALRSRWRG